MNIGVKKGDVNGEKLSQMDRNSERDTKSHQGKLPKIYVDLKELDTN